MRTVIALTYLLSFASSATEVTNTEYGYWQELGLADADLTRFERLIELPGLVSEAVQQDPLLVLGIYAKDKSEQQRFARLYLRRELDRAERELAFFRTYAEIYETEFGNRPLLNLAALGIDPSPNPQPTGDRLTVLVTDNCAPCDTLTQIIMQKIQQAELAGADLYLSGTDREGLAQVWAKRLNLNSELVRNGQITLNLGNALALQLKTKTYPAVFKRIGDQLQQLSLTERLALLGPQP